MLVYQRVLQSSAFLTTRFLQFPIWPRFRRSPIPLATIQPWRRQVIFLRVPTNGGQQRPVFKKMMVVTLVKYDSKNVMNYEKFCSASFWMSLYPISMVSKSSKPHCPILWWFFMAIVCWNYWVPPLFKTNDKPYSPGCKSRQPSSTDPSPPSSWRSFWSINNLLTPLVWEVHYYFVPHPKWCLFCTLQRRGEKNAVPKTYRKIIQVTVCQSRFPVHGLWYSISVTAPISINQPSLNHSSIRTLYTLYISWLNKAASNYTYKLVFCCMKSL